LFRRSASAACAVLCVAGAVLWSLPMLAVGLVALLRYGFGSLFVVGESVASALLRSTGADIAFTVGHLHHHPLRAAGEAACGLVISAGAASLVFRYRLATALLAGASAAEAWWFGMPLITVLLIPATLLALLLTVLHGPRTLTSRG
jgi:hypothetical protein